MSAVKELADALQQFHTVTLSADDAFLKTLTLWFLTMHFLVSGDSIYYFDCDLQYSGLLAQHYESKNYEASLHVFAPGEKEIVQSLVAFLSLPQESERGIVVVDSLNTLQDLLRENDSKDATRANHELATLLTLLQQFAERGNKLLIIANLTRPRPGAEGSSVWQRNIAGGRISRMKSDAIISIKSAQENRRRSIICTVDYLNEKQTSRGLREGTRYSIEAADIISS
jgi:hypothetical protein